MRCESFPPVIADDARLLILGSMPGIVSLQKAQYYAHPRNAFWPILFEVFEAPFSEDYDVRCGLIRANGLALWDAAKTCEREGSLDTAIREVKYNDFASLFARCPIERVLCNGQKAFSLFRRSGMAGDRPVLCLPSTSPALTMPYAEKLDRWREALLPVLMIQEKERK